MNGWWRGTALAMAIGSGLLIGPAFAGDPTGTWLTEGGKSRVRVANCGGALCGTVIWLKDPNDRDTGQPVTDKNNADASKRNRPVIGVDIMIAMKPSGAPDKWAGEVYNPEDGQTYTGSLTVLDGRTVELKGCVFGGLICKGQTWSRVN